MNHHEKESSARPRSFRLFLPVGYLRCRLAVLGFALWLVLLAVPGATVLVFLGGMLIPALDVEVIMHSLLPAIVVVILGVPTTALLTGRIRWLFSGQAARSYLWATALVFSLVVLFYSVELWRGKWAWAKVTQQAAAKGEKIELPDVAPPDVPDDQNFAKAPVFAPFFDLVTNATGELMPRDTPAYQRLRAAAETGSTRNRPGLSADLQRPGWPSQNFTDWEAWYKDRLARTNQAAAISRLLQRGFRKTPSKPEPGQGQVSKQATPTPEESAALLLETLGGAGEILAEIAAVSDRPYARFPVRYEAAMSVSPPAHYRVLYGMMDTLRWRSCAELTLHRDDEALRDVQLALRLVDYARQQPWLLQAYYYRSQAMFGLLQPVWEGLAERRWSEAQVVALQHQLARLDLLEDYPASVRADMLSLIEFVNQIVPTTPLRTESPRLTSEQSDRRALAIVRFLYPRGWSYQDQAALYRFYREGALSALDVSGQRLTLPRRDDLNLRPASADPFFAIFVLPKARQMIDDAFSQYPAVQTALNEALLACALERHRLAHGQFPETLDALVPRFIERLPHDLIAAQPFKYRRTEDGQFVLYSIGRDRVDDGGVTGSDSGRWFSDTGDWVWKYPPKNRPSGGVIPRSRP